ncbi:nicastrin [Anabrus simplex]|uniref:nicastrin n=1 Tax=Anabrus simplex TaxID=316456 RepID=UPI0034DD6F92
MKCGVVCVTLLLSLTVLVSSERMKNKIYDSIDGAAACFRRLNGTHQFGCSSNRLGNVGIIHIIEDSANLTWLLNEGEAVPYVVVLRPTSFTKDILLALKSSGKVNGIILVNNGTDQPGEFSHEDKCPNRYSGLSSFSEQTCDDTSGMTPWNVYGTGLMMVDWGFPIFYVNTAISVNKLYKCYADFNSERRNQRHDRSLCAVEMSSFMLATVNSATCIRRSSMITNFNPMKFCDPLGDRNIWSTLFPRNKTLDEGKDNNRSVIVVAARLDTTSMFDGVTPGAVTPTTGVVALLATAYALSNMVPRNESSGKNVMFTLLNGESFDYIGSSRMVWDMKHGQFPSPLDSNVAEQAPLLKPHHLQLFVELSHLSNYNRTLMFHNTPNSNRIKVQNQKSSFVKAMQMEGEKLNLNFTEVTPKGRLPPASLQTFVSNDQELQGVVIADYKEHFNTPFYHSIFDDKSHLNYTYQNGSTLPDDSIQTFIADFSVTLARVLCQMVSNQTCDGNVTAVKITVDELFHCYLDKANCSLFRAATYKQPLMERPASLYVGVNTWAGQNQITMLTGQTLAYLTGEFTNHTEEQCHNNPQYQIFQYLWVNGPNETGMCVKTTMNYSTATSPAFEISDYDWTSGQYSTWTESVWQELSVRIFLKPSPYHENLIFSIGTVVLILSFVVVYFLNARSHILFGNTLGTGGC